VAGAGARTFWPVGESAQADYETLRRAVLGDGQVPSSLAAAKFTRRGLAGLIHWPTAEPVYSASLVGAPRPAWSPHTDPRLDALASGFAVLLDVARSPRDELALEGAR